MPDPAGVSRILTLVFTDLANSTALKTQRGDQSVGELIARHRAHVRELASQAHGRIIDWAGDGCFLTFETPSAAVAFALRLQQAHAVEQDLPGVRTGIHMGEVSERPGPEGDAHPRIEGLAVDLAARICALARPAQVLMSSAVADSARPRLDSHSFPQPILWRAHGSYSLKGFDEPLEIREAGLEGVASFEAPARPAATQRKALRVGVIAGALGVAIVGLVWWTTSRPSGPQPSDRKSIAVLPFVNMSSDAENEYFSDGITEDLITALSQVSGLQVAARTSSFAFKGKNEPIEKIGAKLHVGAVLEGSVAKAGDRVRITVQLINVADGFHLWSDSYDRELKDIFAIRSEVAETVAQALQVTLASSERQTLAQKPTEDVEAYQLYLKARYAVATYNDFDTAMRYFQQAIERDPSYALAYLGLAYYYVMAVDWWMPADEALPRAREAAEKALRLDPSLAEAHTWLAFVHWWYDQDQAATRHELETALGMLPDSAITHAAYGWFLVTIGETEAGLAAARHAVELDPLSQEINAWLGGMSLYFARHYDDAIDQLRTTVFIDPDYWFPHEWLGRAYARKGRFAEATAELQTAQRLDPGNLEVESALGRVYADAGNSAEALEMLNHLRERSRTEFVSGSNLATIEIGLGQIDKALESLARAAAQHSWLVVFWKVDPELDPLRSDPRFSALLAKVGQKP